MTALVVALLASIPRPPEVRPITLLLTAYGIHAHQLDSERAAHVARTVMADFAPQEPSEASAVRMFGAYDQAVADG